MRLFKFASCGLECARSVASCAGDEGMPLMINERQSQARWVASTIERG